MCYNNYLVSVIIPVYNGEKFIRSAYQEIINQNINNFEIIFVNNNSKDNSVKIIKGIVEFDIRVSLLHEGEQGAAAARNKGLKYFKGEFVYFFDVDDRLAKNSLIFLLDILITNEKYDSVFGDRQVIRNDNDQHDKYNGNGSLVFKNKPHWGKEWFGNVSKLKGTPSFMHRKRVFSLIKHFNEHLLLGEDADFHIRLGIKCNVIYTEKLIFYYNRHSDSTVSKANQKKQNSEKVFQYWPRIYKAHIPFILNEELPPVFEKMLLHKVYGSVVKMITLTNGLKNRISLKNDLYKQMSPIQKPIWFKFFVDSAILFRSIYLYKLFVFYVLRNRIKL